MFTRFTSLLVLVAPLVSALTINTPTGVTSGGTLNITWTTDSSDSSSFSTFSFELVNVQFNDAFAVANNVDPSLGMITIEAPIVTPGDGFTIEAVNIGNISDIFATSGSFSVGATISSSSSGSSSTGTATGTSTSSLPSANLPVTSSSSGSGVGSTGTGTTGTGTSTGTGTGTGTTGTSTSTSTNAAVSRLALTNAGGYAVLLLSAVAGAAAVAL